MDLSEKKYYLIEFGKNFQSIRKSRDYTQAKLAIDLNSDVSYISRVERGIINITIIKLKEVSEILDVSIELFFDF